MDHADGRRAVVRFRDGRVLKGLVHDFAPHKPKFHLSPSGKSAGRPVEVEVAALKALFFVKSWEGDPKRADDPSFDHAAGHGKRVIVTFVDGEQLAGFTVGYAADKQGFFVIPADGKANNTRVFVAAAAVRNLEWVGAGDPAFAAARSRR
jgi:hypothetical protein